MIFTFEPPGNEDNDEVVEALREYVQKDIQRLKQGGMTFTTFVCLVQDIIDGQEQANKILKRLERTGPKFRQEQLNKYTRMWQLGDLK